MRRRFRFLSVGTIPALWLGAAPAFGNDFPDPQAFLSPHPFITGPLMILVGLAAAVGFKWWSGTEWRWLWCGAALWTVAVAVKLIIAFFLNAPLLDALRNHLPNGLYLTLGAGYIGFLSGITEVGLTLAAGVFWRKLAGDARRAVGIGFGAGALEAVLFGLIVAAEPAVRAGKGMDLSVLTLAGMFAPVVERMLVIPCHVAARAMTLYAVATGRWGWFWLGFAFFSSLDAVAGLLHLTGAVHTLNPLVMELSFVGFAGVSVPLIGYVWRQWPGRVECQAAMPAT